MVTHVLVPRGFPVRSARRSPPASLDRLFDELWKSLDAPRARAAGAPLWKPRADLRETPEALVLSLEIPGVDEKDIEVALEDGVLTVRGERAAEEAREGEGWHHAETFRGKFERSLRLPAPVDADAVKAAYRQGILTVTLPKAAEARVRNVPITGPDTEA